MSESALGFALFAEKMDVAKYLVDNGADIYMPYTDKKRNIDYTYLIMAAILDNLKAVQFLVEAAGEHKEEYINFQASDYETALSMALKNSRTEIAKYLIANGADIFKTNSIIKWGTNITLLMEAATVGNMESVKCLVEAAGKRKKEYINMEDSTKRTALIVALMSGYIDVAQYLVNNGADIFQTYSIPRVGAGYTVLMSVAPLGAIKPVQFLVEAAGNRKKEYINATSSDFRTALGMSLGAGQLEVAEYLINNGADILKTFTNKKLTLLEDLVSVNRTEAAQFLIRSSKKRKNKLLNHADIYGMTALMYAAKSNAKESVRMLIEEGAEVNNVDFSGKTALDLAEDRQIQKMLLSAGAKKGSQLKKRRH